MNLFVTFHLRFTPAGGTHRMTITALPDSGQRVGVIGVEVVEVGKIKVIHAEK